MGDGVFGTPITDLTLEGLPEYEGKKIGPLDRARVALKWKNAEGKDAKALQYAMDLKEIWAEGSGVLCLVYNATGNTLEYTGHRDWHGFLGPSPYPIMIENGQWGVFLHRQVYGDDFGSAGAVVYRGTNAENKVRDWMVAWKVERKDTYRNRAYCEAREENHFTADDTWGLVQDYLWKSDVGHKDEADGCLSFVSIGRHWHSTFRAILTLKNANKNN